MEPKFNMQEFLSQKLSAMSDIDDKQILSDLLNDVFLPLYTETETKYNRLEERIYSETAVPIDNYTVYSTLLARNAVDATHSYLAPLLMEDMQPKRIDFSRQSVLDTIFIPEDSFLLEEEFRRPFSGVIKTNKGDIASTFELKRSSKYSQEVFSLYKLFLFNHIPWTTINFPYILHYFDVVSLETDPIQPDTIYEGFYSEKTNHYLTKYAELQDLIPVWNIRNKSILSKVFSEPALDKVNYEYQFDLSEISNQSDFLIIPKDNLLSVRHGEQTITAVSSEDEQFLCELKQIVPYTKKPTEFYSFPIFNNQITDTFGRRLSRLHGSHIKTTLEINRALNEIGMSSYFLLREMKVSHSAQIGETQEVNDFIKDEIRDSAISKSLNLTFENKEATTWFDRDLLSYYCSHLQFLYPEYHVVGFLVEQGAWAETTLQEGVAF